jgi:hypothetical protein
MNLLASEATNKFHPPRAPHALPPPVPRPLILSVRRHPVRPRACPRARSRPRGHRQIDLRQARPYGAAAAIQLRGPRGRALSKSLAALWKRSDDATPAEDEPVPGFDIASNSQDREIARVEVKVEKQDAARATVAAKLFNKGPRIKYPASDDIVRYDFVRENGRWLIDNIRSTIHGKEWTIRGLLNEGLKS